MLIGYMRVSSADERQSVDLQRDALIAAGVDERHLHQDRASGARDDRPGLKACLADLRPGDVLVVWKLDRLGALALSSDPDHGACGGELEPLSLFQPFDATSRRRSGWHSRQSRRAPARRPRREPPQTYPPSRS